MTLVGVVLTGVAAFAVVVFHMVRPNFRSLRISASRFLPDPPKSSAPRNRIVLSLPPITIRFLLRLMLVAIALSALVLNWPDTESDTRPATALRVLLDISGSMAVSVDTAETSRLDQARVAIFQGVEQFLLAAPEDQNRCIELFLVGRSVVKVAVLHSVGNAQEVAGLISPISAERAGSSAARLGDALAATPDSACNASHALVVTDRPALSSIQSRFKGTVLWHQIGQSSDNVGVIGASVEGGGLRGGPREIVARIQVYGTDLANLSASVQGPSGRLASRVRRDPDRALGWLVRFDATEAGMYEIVASPGGSFAGDDRLQVILDQSQETSVDWKLTSIVRPAVFAASSGPSGSNSILVAQFAEVPENPERPVLGVYPGWAGRNRAMTIGPFIENHPIMENVDFDLFEEFAPRPMTNLPAGTISVIRPSNSTRSEVWVGIRNNPRMAIIPEPLLSGDENVRAMSLLIFFNALKWVSDESPARALSLLWRDSSGMEYPRADLESDTAAATTVLPDYALFSEAANVSDGNIAATSDAENATNQDISDPEPNLDTDQDRYGPLNAWLIVTALLLLGFERVWVWIGPGGRNRDL